MDQIKIGKFIASMRKKKGYTQAELADRLEISNKTISKWECGNGLPEVVFMMPLCELLDITVNELLSGEKLLQEAYEKKAEENIMRLVEEMEIKTKKDLLKQFYHLEVTRMERSVLGAGSLTYFITCEDGSRYVVKYASENEMNHPEKEPELCVFLRQNGIPASEFVKNKMGQWFTTDENGRQFHVQKYIEGKTYDYQEAPEWLMPKMARMLGKIHNVMSDYEGLDIGIGEPFFRFMTPQQALMSYEKSWELAKANQEEEIVQELEYRMQQMKHFPQYHFDLGKLTCAPTHGDYMISQLLCCSDEVAGVVDWTTACIHPIVWEIIRSYLYATSSIDIDHFISYVEEYSKENPLQPDDYANMAKVFYYQIAVCDYYSQYYNSAMQNRYIYLKQARLCTELMRWFEMHIDELTKRLVEHFC